MWYCYSRVTGWKSRCHVPLLCWITSSLSYAFGAWMLKKSLVGKYRKGPLKKLPQVKFAIPKYPSPINDVTSKCLLLYTFSSSLMHPWGTKKHQNSTFNATFSWNTQTHGPCVFFLSRIPIPTTPLKTNLYIGSCLNTGNSARFIGFLSYKKNRSFTHCYNQMCYPSWNWHQPLKMVLPQHPLGSAVSFSELGLVVITISSIFFFRRIMKVENGEKNM